MEQQILRLFTFNDRLRFSDMGKKLSMRSNKLAYYIKKLVENNKLIKKNGKYSLSDDLEDEIPYLSEQKSIIPVVLIRIGDKNKVFLYRRNKRPYKNYFGLPGGRLMRGEEISEAAKRIMLQKCKIIIRPEKETNVILEHVKRKGRVRYSFLLLIVKAKTKQKIKLYSINKFSRRIIPSDLFIINNGAKNDIKIRNFYSKEKNSK